MKFTVKQSDFAKGLSVAGHAVSSKSSLPILANILIDAQEDRLKLHSTNLEIGIVAYIDAEIEEPGRTTAPAKLLTDLVSSLPAGAMEITVDESHTMSLKSARSNATIRGMDPEEFPKVPSVDGSETPILIDAVQLKEIINQVTLAAAEDDSRPVLTGVYTEIGAGQITCAAADAFRVAARTVSVPGAEEREPLLIPAKTLEELARILPGDGEIQMLVTKNRGQVLFHTETVDMASRLIDGTFPNYRGVIPQNHGTRVIVETKEFAAAVKSVAPFARDSSNIMRLKVTEDSLTVEAKADDLGSNVCTISATVDGPDIEMMFNIKYVVDILNAVHTPEISLEMTTTSRPGVLKPVSQDDLTYVIMPMSATR